MKITIKVPAAKTRIPWAKPSRSFVDKKKQQNKNLCRK